MKKFSKEKNSNKFFVFFVSVLITALAAFSLPIQTLLPGGIVPDSGRDKTTNQNSYSKYSLFTDDAVYIINDWEFYWDKLIITDQNGVPEPDLIVDLPSSWTTYELNGDRLKSGGVATYRKVLKDFYSPEGVVFTLPNLPGAYRVYIDGVLVSANCRNDADMRSRNLSNSTEYLNPVVLNYATDNSYEVIIEVSCQHSSGITVLPVLINSAQNEIYTTSLLAYRFLVLGLVLMFIVSIFAISIIAFKDGRFFWLIVLCLTFFFRLLISGNGYSVASVMFFNLNYEIILSLIYATTYILKLALFMNVIHTFNIKVSENFMVVISGVFLLCVFVPQFVTDVIYNTTNYMFLQAVSYILDIYLIYKLSELVSRKERFASEYLLASSIFIASLIVDNYYINGYIQKNASFVFPVAGSVFIVILLLVQVVKIGEAYVAEKQNAIITKELADVNMTLMLSQIKPHFLYNALNTIKYLIKKDPKTAEQVVVKFANYLRANMDSLTQKTPLPVTKEIQHVQNYTDIEKHRFGNRLNVIYDIQCDDFVILPLTIQPIVENAIKHGINQKPEGGTVTIKTYDDENCFYVDISDDGIGYDVNSTKVDEDKERSHVGISNIKIRLKEMLNATVGVESEVGVGTKVLITIPKNDETRYAEC